MQLFTVKDKILNMYPKIILEKWDVAKLRVVKQITSGLLNETYKIESGKSIFFLQKLHPKISYSQTKNYKTLTDFMRTAGFQTQEVIPSAKGKLVVRSGFSRWRLLRGIHGHVYNVAPSTLIARETGRCLGRTHKLLSGFNEKLQPTLPMFCYNKVLRKLHTHRKKLDRDTNPNVREATNFLCLHLPKYRLPTSLPKKIIHTDPKISNFVFNQKGQALTMIDWDTAQCLSPLYDIGDAIRSLCGQEEDNLNNKFNVAKYKSFLAGYFSSAKNYLSERERRLIPRVICLVILGLSSRFLNDYIDNFYFGWDSKRYRSRKEHNLARVLGQISLYKNFLSQRLG